MVDTRRKYWKIPMTTTGTDNTLLNFNDLDMVKEAKLKNFSLVYQYFLSKNDKTQALSMLLEYEKSYCNMAVVREIIHTYLYFNDFEGALEYIEKSKLKISYIKHYEYLIKIHLADKNKGCSDDTIFNLVKEGLTAGYDSRFVGILKEFYCKNCKGCLNNCLVEKMTAIQAIIENFHFKNLSYKDSKYLYKMMPGKGIFLKKMVQLNPKIKKKYYLEYAKLYGFNKEDISRILQAKFKIWAVEIALFFGWLEEIHQSSMEKDTAPYPVCLNRKAKWNFKDKDIFRFKDGV